MKLRGYLSKFAELEDLYEEVRRDFLKKGLAHHNWNHVLRDLARGIMIGEEERADMKVVLAGILLHDIGRLYPKTGRNHYSLGAEVAPRYLEKAGFSQEEIEGVVRCIRSHGPRGLEEPGTLEAKVCYDVDVLSCSVGYIGVARVFDYFLREEEMNVKQILELPSGRKGPREDFYTRVGRKLGQDGFKKAERFWKELHQEFAEEERTASEIISDYEGD